MSSSESFTILSTSSNNITTELKNKGYTQIYTLDPLKSQQYISLKVNGTGTWENLLTETYYLLIKETNTEISAIGIRKSIDHTYHIFNQTIDETILFSLILKKQ
ncbi:MAG: hypothetical protein ACRCWI_05660 [Brevinema sp.]